ncbi:MAG: cation:proton antiporter [Clostridia bacterium]|nr:cation:proton antiporter [Clostridia bacterium]
MNEGLVNFLFHFAIILFSTKMLGILMRKLGLPQVLGFIIAGVLIGPAIWGLFTNIGDKALFPILESDYLGAFAEIGVVFVMFTAGLETNISDIKKTGVVSFAIAGLGVLVPLGLGIGVGAIFLPSSGFFTWLFIGVIMTATSVGITVEVMRELGKLNTKVGTIVLSAAIIDDVLGIIILSVALSLSGGGLHSAVIDFVNPSGNIAVSIIWILCFFVFAIGAGFGFSKLFKYIEKKSPHTRRIPILSIALCALYAFIAEKVFGVADITGAYIAGLVLSTNHASAQYVDRKVTISSYTIFAPIFFAYIGIKMSFNGLNSHVIIFSLVFVLTAILAKIIGCGGMARCLKFSNKDSFRIGIGMIARGEVALIVTEKGIAGGLLLPEYRVAVVLLVIVTSLISPIILKLLYKNDKPMPSRQELEEGQFE